MKKISAKSAIAVFYYLMSVDSEIAENELHKLDEIGNELDPENYAAYRDEMIELCEVQKKSIIEEEDSYDVISEGIDQALQDEIKDEDHIIAPRLLVWNLLVISYSDEEYHHEERRLIKHIVRTTGIPTSVFLEMEQLIKAANDVERERAWLSESDMPYREIAPIIAELDKRIEQLSESAKHLVEDEIMIPEIAAAELQPTVFDHVENAVAPIGEKAGEAVKSAATAVSDWAVDAGKQVGNFFGGLFK